MTSEGPGRAPSPTPGGPGPGGAPGRRLETALADLVSGVAHEIRNPINTISLTSQVLQKRFEKKGLDLDEFREYFRVIHFELGKIKKIIDNFVKFARVPDLEPEPTPVDGLLARILADLGPELEARGVEVERALAPGLTVMADAHHLPEAFLHLLDNAVQSVSPGGRIRVEATRRGDRVRVCIQDSGPGLSGEDPERIFHPYYTTVRGGLGLGLTLSRSIIESHGGEISARTLEQGGAEFQVELPLVVVESGDSDHA